MDDTESKESRAEFQQGKKDLSVLRSQFTALSIDKEKAYQQLKEFQSSLHQLIETIKKCKEERDTFTTQVKSLKGEREKLNQAVKEKAGEKKQVAQQKEEITHKMARPENPARLKAQIAAMERAIETEVMPFSEEQKLTKRIKELKVQYKKIEQLDRLWKESSALSAEFSHTRQAAEETHRNLQAIAQQSQQKHEELKGLYEQLKKARAEEKPLREKYLGLKQQCEALRKKGEELLKRVNELAKKFKEDEGQSFQHIVEQKKAEVQEKLKKGKKLSTKDILAFQASKE
ncbi:hypothetical protein HYU22_03040 [Candidatus Woesearchaeota archaeon]|nr:hypothetical protein [Candidatus Woesearchaeota archaeon]